MYGLILFDICNKR